MKIERYGNEYLSRAVEILRTAQNAVAPVAQFGGLGGLVDGDGEKLGKFLRKMYTVIATEDDVPIGIASMNNDGEIGLVTVDGNAPFGKTVKTLLRALERRALKKELPSLSVSPTAAADVCTELGFVPSDTEPSLYTKRVVDKSSADFPPERARRITLDSSAPISVEGKTSGFAVVFFIVSCFFVVLWTALFLTLGIDGEGGSEQTYFILLAVVGSLFVISLAFFIRFLVKRSVFKRELRAMSVTNGIVTNVSSHSQYAGHENGDYYTDVSIDYMFYDYELNKRKATFRNRYRGRGAYFYVGQELIIAFTRGESYILNRYTVISDPDADEDVAATDDVDMEESAAVSSGKSARAVKAAERDPSALVPFGATLWNVVFAAALLSVVVIVVGVLMLFSALTAAQTSSTLWEEVLVKLPFMIVVLVVFGGWGGYYLVCIVKAKSTYRKIRKNGAMFVHGKLECTEKTFGSKNKPKFYCEYSAANGEKRRIYLPRMSAEKLVMHGDTDVVVAYAGTAAVVLVSKDSIINKIRLR